MKKNTLLLIISGIFILSCNNIKRSEKYGQSTLPFQVDIENDISNTSSLSASLLGKEIEYIPLETDTACLIKSISNVYVSDPYIWVSDGSRLLAFTIEGKFLKQIGSSGRGPGEYTRVADFIINEEKKEIYVLSSRLVLVYDFDGRFIRDFKIDFACTQFILENNNTIIFHPFNLSGPSTGPVYSWYITDVEGNIQTKLINTLPRINRGLAVPSSPLYMYDAKAHFMEFGVDTLYQYTNSVKVPYTIFYFGKFKLPPDPTMEEVPGIDGKIWINNVKELEKYFFIKLWWNISDSISNSVYDKSSGRLTILKNGGFTNDIDGGMDFWPEKIINDKLLIDYTDSFDLLRWVATNPLAESGKSDHLREVTKNLTETSNPVLIILEI